MNKLWGGMLLVGVVYAAFTGNLGAVTEQAVSSAKEAISLCITMMGVMSFWVGMMRIAENGGILGRATEIMDPVIRFLFPGLGSSHPARKHIATNMIANILGLGWAATPAGLEAMKELNKPKNAEVIPAGKHEKSADREDDRSMATDEMCDFLILNISSLQLIPVNIIAYRSQYGSVNPAYIVGPAIVATICSTAAAVLFIKIRRVLGRRA